MEKKKRGPGRPSLGPDGVKTKRVPIDAPETDIDDFREAAMVEGMRLSEWGRLVLKRAARRTLKRAGRR